MGFQHLLMCTVQGYCNYARVSRLNVHTFFFNVRKGLVYHKTDVCGESIIFTRITPTTGKEVTRSASTFAPCNTTFQNALLLKIPQKRAAASRSFCTSTQVIKDVILFEHDRTGFFRLLAFFCSAQLLFWTYLAHFAYTGLRDTAVIKEQGKLATTGLAGPWSFSMNLGSTAWRYGFTLGCLVIGGGIIGLGAAFCSRSVSRVILHKGGKMVTVSTQSPLGFDKGRKITVPLSQVACHAHRQESPSFIPLKVKGHRFYFLLDKEGRLNNLKLFDHTVGAYRPL